MDLVRQIADAILYEGYLLWPYRRSALKNRQRWTFGGVYPAGHSAGRAGDDPSEMQTQCLLEGDEDTELDVRVRFLQVVVRQVFAAEAEGLVPVDELEVGGERRVSWQEAAEREVEAERIRPSRLGEPRRVNVHVAAGTSGEELRTAARPAGALRRSWKELRGTIDIGAEEVRAGLFRLTVRIHNDSGYAGKSREDALLQTFCSTHTVLAARGGAFVSLTDPPDAVREAAGDCENVGTWPVLVGPEDDRSTMLSSPIILPDYPQIAPESPGDLFDATEIDQMLVLNILSLTDEERQEMRDSDPRAREILERTEALSDQELMNLHGAVREFGLARRQ
jgi:hypothetical protein